MPLDLAEDALFVVVDVLTAARDAAKAECQRGGKTPQSIKTIETLSLCVYLDGYN